jgi:hypothetical protein
MDYQEFCRLKSKAGQRRIELYGNPATPESRAKGGHTQGTINAAKCRENGTGIFAHASRVKGGHITGTAIQAIQREKRMLVWDPEKKMARKGGHVTKHVNKGRFNPECSFCTGEER